ncbi:MAG: hypothetical protein R3B72_15120 [Polyangiaceae bacterium]
MIGSLNPKRYRVEHNFGLAEGVLRAKIVLAHAIVVHTESVDVEAMRDLEAIAERCTPILVSADPHWEDAARELGGRFVQEPFETHVFKRSVYRAVSKTQDRRHQGFLADSSTRRAERIVLLQRSPSQSAVMAAVLRNQLGTVCECATEASDVLGVLEAFDVGCVVAEPELLLASADGALLAGELARRGIPVVPLTSDEDLDVSSAGQAAWDIAPHVRRTLTALSTRMRAVG